MGCLPNAQPTPAYVHCTAQITREVFEASKGRLKVVGRAGVGIDNVDLAAASENGCLVVNGEPNSRGLERRVCGH